MHQRQIKQDRMRTCLQRYLLLQYDFWWLSRPIDPWWTLLCPYRGGLVEVRLRECQNVPSPPSSQWTHPSSENLSPLLQTVARLCTRQIENHRSPSRVANRSGSKVQGIPQTCRISKINASDRVSGVRTQSIDLGLR